MNLAGEVKEKTHVQGGAHRADKFISLIPQSKISVLNPNLSRNKGCGSQIKSGRETAIETGEGKECAAVVKKQKDTMHVVVL